MRKCYFLVVLVEVKMKKIFKVACVVKKMKLFFYGLNLLLFHNTNYVMQNTIQKFRQSTIVLEKPGILSENLKTWTNSSYPTAQYFSLKLDTRFLLTNVYKSCKWLEFVSFYLDLELFEKVIKTWFLHTHFLRFYWKLKI